MARRKLEHLIDENGDETGESIIDGDYEDMSALQHDIDEQLDSIFSEIGDGDNDVVYAIKVYRSQKDKGKLGYLFTCTVHELPILDRLRDEYGGGDFEVRVLGKGKIKARRVVCVEAPPKKKDNFMEPMNGLGEIMAQGFTRLGELIVTSQNSPPQNTMRDMMENMVLMKQVMGDPTPPTNAMDQIKSVLEIQRLIGGKEKGSETNVNDVLLSLAETVLPKLAEAGGSLVTTPENVPETPVVGVNPISTSIEKTNKGNPMKMHLVFLTMQASNKKDPALYAQLVLDNTEDDKIDELFDFMNHDDAIKNMAAIHAPVASYVPWFEKLREEIFKLIEVDEENTGDSTLIVNEKTSKNTNDVSNATENNGNTIIDTQRNEGDKARHESDVPIS